MVLNFKAVSLLPIFSVRSVLRRNKFSDYTEWKWTRGIFTYSLSRTHCWTLRFTLCYSHVKHQPPATVLRHHRVKTQVTINSTGKKTIPWNYARVTLKSKGFYLDFSCPRGEMRWEANRKGAETFGSKSKSTEEKKKKPESWPPKL